MQTIVITGGIATGKSTVLEFLSRLDPDLVLFDCDASAAMHLNSTPVAEELLQHFGPESLTPEGFANKDFLRKLVFQNQQARKTLETLLHPRILQECLALHQDTVKNGRASGFIIDIPLFFEGGFDFQQDLVVVVSLSPEVQKQRLMHRNGFNEALVNSILNAQLPLAEKENKADVILWNDGPLSWLKSQTNLLYNHYFI